MPAINGEKIIAVALDGEMGEGPVQATASGDGFRLTGTRTQVGYGPVADAFLVPAETDSGTKVFLVAKDDAGVTVECAGHDRPRQCRASRAARCRGSVPAGRRWRRCASRG